MHVTATQFAKKFGEYKEAAQREPIAITSHGRTSGYFLSPNEYQEYQRLKARDRQAYHISELPPSTLEAILNARVSPEYDHLNRLLDD